ncbi:MAG: NAD(P)H-binding protein [Acetobacteraceae bacterium]
MTAPVHVVAATGRSGLALSRALLARGDRVVAVVRDAAKWRAAGLAGDARVADLRDDDALRSALHDATRIASCAHARHIPAILRAAPPDARFVFLGSTRKFTRWPDAHGNGVLAGEAALLDSGRPGVLLNPTMIYGAQGENNVQRLAALLRRLPVVPLPGGGRSLVQPIHQADVTAAILAALDRPWPGPTSLVIAGGASVSYAGFIRAIAAAAGLRPPRILPFPAAPLIALAPLTRLLPGLPRVEPAELRRLLEDKAFDIAPMRAELGVDPMTLPEGLARTFRSHQDSG